MGLYDYSVTRYLQNIASVESYINKKYGVSNVVVGGHSLGGLVSILYGARSPVRAVVALCAPKEMLGTASKTWKQDGVRRSILDLPDGSGQRSYVVPWSFVEDSSQYSALSAVKSLKNTPLLLLAGGKR